jgi:hypothetical protein
MISKVMLIGIGRAHEFIGFCTERGTNVFQFSESVAFSLLLKTILADARHFFGARQSQLDDAL